MTYERMLTVRESWNSMEEAYFIQLNKTCSTCFEISKSTVNLCLNSVCSVTSRKLIECLASDHAHHIDSRLILE